MTTKPCLRQLTRTSSLVFASSFYQSPVRTPEERHETEKSQKSAKKRSRFKLDDKPEELNNSAFDNLKKLVPDQQTTNLKAQKQLKNIHDEKIEWPPELQQPVEVQPLGLSAERED